MEWEGIMFSYAIVVAPVQSVVDATNPYQTFQYALRFKRSIKSGKL